MRQKGKIISLKSQNNVNRINNESGDHTKYTVLKAYEQK